MRLTYSWLVKDRVIYAWGEGTITSEDVLAGYEEIGRLVQPLPPDSVYFLYDARELTIPLNWSTIVAGLRGRRSNQIIATITITRHSNPLVEIAMSLLTRIYRMPGYYVTTCEDAVTLLCSLDPSLKDVLPESIESIETTGANIP